MKNNQKINNLFKNVPNYKVLFEQENMVCFDESYFFYYLGTIKETVSIFNKKILLNQEYGKDSYQEYVMNKCFWKEGTVYCKNEEIMYLHFMVWKYKMFFSEVLYPNYKSFYISYKGIHYLPFAWYKKLYFNTKNYFFGFYFSKRIKKIKKAIKKTFFLNKKLK
jgi:hypothetical protein